MKIKQQTVKTAHPLGDYHLASYHCFGVLSGHLRPMPGSRLLILPAVHLSNIEYPDAFRSALLEFLLAESPAQTPATRSV
jgi:hypothetical protein